jgi:Ca-activated chloride channel homolog
MDLNKAKWVTPALLMAALAFFLFTSGLLLAPSSSAQKVKQVGPPPPGWRLKPKPTPKPSPTPAPEYEVVKITSNLVMVPVSVTNTQGQPVLGLKPTDFRIEEDGRVQEISQLGNPEQVPLDIALLIDVSGSVVARFDFERQAAATFLKQVLKPEDRATIFAIDKTPRMVQALTTSQSASQSLLTVTPANSYTAFFDSVLAAARYLDQSSATGRRRIVLVISDGDDTARIASVIADKSMDGKAPTAQQAQLDMNQKAQLDTQRDVQKAEITFYSINPSGQTLHLNVRTARAQQNMERMATATGGASFIPRDEAELPVIFDRIANEIRSQYLLQYYSNNQTGSRAFRRIAVSTPAQKGFRIRTREGYFPKAK